jgi:perosamine synthetase
MWSRKRIDIGWSDLATGAARCCFSPEQSPAAEAVERLWPRPEHVLVCLSVRSGFDLLLESLALPPGSDVLMSALTIADMPRIVAHHGLVPVPFDLDPACMAPTVEHLRRVLRPAARAIVVAHLFGGRIEMEPILDFAREHGLLVIEDCAQAYAGTDYQGHPASDASMFSFGTIKSSTALGGAVLRVRDIDLLRRMRVAHAAYPVQYRRLYLKRLLKNAGLKSLSFRPVARGIIRTCRALGRDYDHWVNGAARSFPGPDFFARIRQQPSAALLAVLGRRLRGFSPQRLAAHVRNGDALLELLRDRVYCPGAASRPHTYWVFPILVEDPVKMIDALARDEFDATQGQSLAVVPPPADHPEFEATAAKEVLAKVVFLPFYPAMPLRAAQKMAAVVLEHCGAMVTADAIGRFMPAGPAVASPASK